MADLERNAVRKAIRKTNQQTKQLKQAGGFVVLLLALWLPPALLPQSFSQPHPSGPTESKENHFSGPQDPLDEKLLKIQMILSKFKTGLSDQMETQLSELIYHESLKYQYDPELILALVITESSFYNWSRSKMGALGLMQILPATGREVAAAQDIPWQGKKTLFDPHLNIKLGTRYLAALHDRFGSLEVALTAYNYGPTRVAKMQRQGVRLPQAYTRRILKIYERFLSLHHPDLIQSWHPDELEDLLGLPPSRSVKI